MFAYLQRLMMHFDDILYGEHALCGYSLLNISAPCRQYEHEMPTDISGFSDKIIPFA
jgi:hypothetical protein